MKWSRHGAPLAAFPASVYPAAYWLAPWTAVARLHSDVSTGALESQHPRSSKEGTRTPKTPTRRGQRPVVCSVDLGGAYYNPKPQVEALEKLLRKLPDPGAPAPPPAKRRKPGRVRHLEPDQVEKLIANYQAGATVYELGAQFKINRKTVSRTLRRHHIPMRRTSLRPEQINEAARLYQHGWSTGHIAQHLNTHQRTVQRRLAEKDVTMHSTNQRRLKPPTGLHADSPAPTCGFHQHAGD